MNLQETIRKILKEEDVSKLILKIIRRVDLETAVEQSLEWSLKHYRFNAKENGLYWFIDTVIYNVYIDYISEIFEEWDDNFDSINITISENDRNKIMKYLEKHFYYKIEKEYNKRFGQEEPYKRPK